MALSLDGGHGKARALAPLSGLSSAATATALQANVSLPTPRVAQTGRQGPPGESSLIFPQTASITQDAGRSTGPRLVALPPPQG